MFEHLSVSKPAERVCRITLNRPRQFNALARQTILELHQALTDFEESPDDILLVTGSGRFFCFGADFMEFEDKSALPSLLQSFQDLILRLYHCPKITVACLNGFATGAGFDLALACDFRLASDKCKVGEAYISMGLVPDGGGSFFMTRLLGISRALEFLATGDSIEAQEAHRLGLLHRLFSSETLQEEALSFAKSLCEKPQTALRQIKQLVKSPSVDLKTALEQERKSQLLCFADPTHQSIVRDFLAKRRNR